MIIFYVCLRIDSSKTMFKNWHLNLINFFFRQFFEKDTILILGAGSLGEQREISQSLSCLLPASQGEMGFTLSNPNQIQKPNRTKLLSSSLFERILCNLGVHLQVISFTTQFVSPFVAFLGGPRVPGSPTRIKNQENKPTCKWDSLQMNW